MGIVNGVFNSLYEASKECRILFLEISYPITFQIVFQLGNGDWTYLTRFRGQKASTV
jgi:hypothetical protein